MTVISQHTLHCDVRGGQSAECDATYVGRPNESYQMTRHRARDLGWRTEGPHALALADICPEHPPMDPP